MSEKTPYQQPFLVPASEELLVKLNGFHDGTFSYTEFVDSMELHRDELDNMLSQFLPSVPISDRPDAAEKQRYSLNILASALNDLTTVIPQMLEYADAKRQDMYELLLERLGRILMCERLAIDQYNQATIPNGPTDMPFVNAVIDAQKRYFAGEIPEHVYLRVVGNIIEKLDVAYKEIDEKTSFDANAKSELLFAYRSFSDALESLRTYVAEGEAFATGLIRDVIEAAQRVRDSIKIYTFHANTSGPTRMIQANLMINMAEAWAQGKMDPNLFLRALDIFADDLDRTWRQLQAMASLPHDAGETISDLMGTLQGAYEEQFRAVELYRTGVAGNMDALQEARVFMERGANKAADCRDAFNAMGDTVGKVPCMRCGTYNLLGSRNCENCGARLLGSEAIEVSGSSTISYQENGGKASMGEDFVITPQLRKLFESVNAVTEGLITKEDYAEAIKTYRNFLAKNYDVDEIAQHMLSELPDHDGQLPQRVEEIGNELYTALSEVNNALEILEQYVEDTNSQYVFDGVLGMRDASIKLQKVLSRLKSIVNGQGDCDEDSSSSAGFGEVLTDGDDMSVGFVG